jgi:protein AATF/BFR2
MLNISETCYDLLEKLVKIEKSLYSEHSELASLAELASKKRKRHSSVYGDYLHAQFNNFTAYRNATINKWNEKTQLQQGILGEKAQSTALSNSNLKILNQSVLTQIETILADQRSLIRRTQLKRGDYELLGRRTEGEKSEEKESSVLLDGRVEVYDEELFDDNDFYSSLLQEIIANSSGLMTGARSSEDLLATAKSQRRLNKKNGLVERRASKGRKLKYSINPKLVNFCAPQPQHNQQFAVEELFANLFGRKPAKSHRER